MEKMMMIKYHTMGITCTKILTPAPTTPEGPLLMDNGEWTSFATDEAKRIYQLHFANGYSRRPGMLYNENVGYINAQCPGSFRVIVLPFMTQKIDYGSLNGEWFWLADDGWRYTKVWREGNQIHFIVKHLTANT